VGASERGSKPGGGKAQHQVGLILGKRLERKQRGGAYIQGCCKGEGVSSEREWGFVSHRAGGPEAHGVSGKKRIQRPFSTPKNTPPGSLLGKGNMGR